MHSVAVMEFKIVREVWGERPNCKKRACDSKPKDPKEESEKESMAHSGKASPTLKNPEGIPCEGQHLLVKFSRLQLKLDKKQTNPTAQRRKRLS